MSQPIRAAEAPAGQQSPWRMFAGEVIAGGCGGAVGIAAAAPAMYFKTYHQLKAENPHNHPPFEKNPLKWFAGWKGLAGWMFPQTAFAFIMNEALRNKFSHNGERELSGAEKLGCSVATGGMLGPMVAVQELIWTQQKVAEGQGAPKSAAQVAQEIWSKHGVKGFFRGIGETSLREMVSASILTYLVEGHPIMAPVIGAVVSQPVDSRKTLKQADFSYNASLREMFRLKAFAGLATGRIPVCLIFMNVTPFVREAVFHRDQVMSWSAEAD